MAGRVVAIVHHPATGPGGLNRLVTQRDGFFSSARASSLLGAASRWWFETNRPDRPVISRDHQLTERIRRTWRLGSRRRELLLGDSFVRLPSSVHGIDPFHAKARKRRSRRDRRSTVASGLESSEAGVRRDSQRRGKAGAFSSCRGSATFLLIPPFEVDPRVFRVRLSESRIRRTSNPASSGSFDSSLRRRCSVSSLPKKLARPFPAALCAWRWVRRGRIAGEALRLARVGSVSSGSRGAGPALSGSLGKLRVRGRSRVDLALRSTRLPSEIKTRGSTARGSGSR